MVNLSKTAGQQPRRSRTIGLFAFIAVLAMGGRGFADDKSGMHRLVFLDGRQLTTTIVGITAKGQLQLSGQSSTVTLNDLRGIEPVKPPARKDAGQVRLGLLGGGVLRAKSVALNEEKFTVNGGFAAGRALPLESVRSVLFASKADEAFTKAAGTTNPDVDRLIVKLRGKLRTVSALTESLNATTAAVSLDDRTSTIPLADIHGIVFAYVKTPINRNGLCHVSLVDGSVLPGHIIGLTDGKLTLRLIGKTELTVPWDAVAEITIASDRLQFLSDLTPSDVTEQAIISLPRKWQKDRNVTGVELAIGKSSFKKGLGVHARSQLTFNVDQKFQEFAATIGLDTVNGKKGDCIFVVMADGRELFRKRMRGSDKPHTFKVPIKQARRLVLLVEPGENLDIADHANWCDAILIRPSK